MCDFVQQIDIAFLALTCFQAEHDLLKPVGSFATRRALTAGFVLIELNPAGDHANHRGRFIEDLQGSGTEHRTGSTDGFVIQRCVKFGFGEDRS